MAKARILWVDNEPGHVDALVGFLRDEGFSVTVATSAAECRDCVRQAQYDLVLVDIYLPQDPELSSPTRAETLYVGKELARWLRNLQPDLRVVGCSVSVDEQLAAWFERYCCGFWQKGSLRPSRALTSRIERLVDGQLRVFLVHGHDEALKYEVKNYFQNTLKLGEPVVLHEQAVIWPNNRREIRRRVGRDRLSCRSANTGRSHAIDGE